MYNFVSLIFCWRERVSLYTQKLGPFIFTTLYSWSWQAIL